MTDEMVDDDRAAVAWAVFAMQTAAGQRVTERMSRGEKPSVTDELLVAIREEWEAAGRPIVRPHAHRDAVTFADGTAVVGVRFLVDDPYTREEAPTFGLYLDERWAPPWDHAHLPWIDSRCHRAARCARGPARPSPPRRARRGRLPRGARSHRHRSGVPRRPDRNPARRGGRLGAACVLREGGRDRRAAGVRRRVRPGSGRPYAIGAGGVSETRSGAAIGWNPGDVVVQENYYAGHLVTAFAEVVVDDGDDHLALYTRAGSIRVDGTMPHRSSTPLEERMRVYELTEPQPLEERPVRFHVLTLNPHAEHHSYWVFWWPDWRFHGWYVNLQPPYERTRNGIAIGRGSRSGDYYLDLAVGPDMAWAWKDRDEFDAACELGLLTTDERDIALAEAQRMIERIEQGSWPFDEPWQDWRPSDDWPKPNLRLAGPRRWRIEVEAENVPRP